MLKAPLLPETAKPSSRLPAVFFLLGTGSTISFTSVALAIAYFQPTLGSNILSLLLCTHCSTVLAVMLLLLLLLPRAASRRTTYLLLIGALAFAFVFNLFILVSLYAGGITRVRLLTMVALNGVATGVLQAGGAAMGSDIESGRALSGKIASLQLAGDEALPPA